MQGHKLQRTFLLIGICLFLAGCKADEQVSTNNNWSEFYGTFTGSAENVLIGEVEERDLVVEIKPWQDKGFTVQWKTVIYRAGGKKKEADMSINFYPSNRPGIYASAMRTDVFGQSVPYDPVAEDAAPYVWAGIDGDTLTVSALYIVDNGGYEIQVYKRSLNQDGMTLEFQRLRDGEKTTEVAAQLEPAK